jgi:hypothetical protein
MSPWVGSGGHGDCVEGDVITGVATEGHHHFVGDPSAALISVLLTVGLGRRGRWCARVWKEERKPVV